MRGPFTAATSGAANNHQPTPARSTNTPRPSPDRGASLLDRAATRLRDSVGVRRKKFKKKNTVASGRQYGVLRIIRAFTGTYFEQAFTRVRYTTPASSTRACRGLDDTRPRCSDRGSVFFFLIKILILRGAIHVTGKKTFEGQGSYRYLTGNENNHVYRTMKFLNIGRKMLKIKPSRALVVHTTTKK